MRLSHLSVTAAMVVILLVVGADRVAGYTFHLIADTTTAAPTGTFNGVGGPSISGGTTGVFWLLQ